MIKVVINSGGTRIRLRDFGMKAKQLAILGKTARESERKRVKAGLASDDSVAPALSVPYARRKQRYGKGTRRDLTWTGKMLDNRSVTASSDKARVDNTTRLDRAKARNNERISPWVGLSPTNVKEVVERAQRMHGDNVVGLKARMRGGTRQNFYTSI